MSDNFRLVSLSELTAGDNGFSPLFAPAVEMADADDKVHTEPPTPAEDPYARGVSDGQDMAHALFASEREGLLKLIGSAEALQPEPSDELAVLIGESVATLVTQIVGDVAIDRTILETRARQAAAIIAECDAARTMWLHPDDADLLRDASLPLEIGADPEAERGSIRIDCSSGWIEHGTALYLERLRMELGLTGAAQ